MKTLSDLHRVHAVPRRTKLARLFATADEIRKRKPSARFRVVSPISTKVLLDRVRKHCWDLAQARAVLTKSGTITGIGRHGCATGCGPQSASHDVWCR